MKETYKNIGPLPLRVIEECNELIHAICKAERFGWNNYHPDTPNVDNTFNVHSELLDVIAVCESLRDKIIKGEEKEKECEGIYQSYNAGWFLECIKCGKRPSEHKKKEKEDKG